jgi:hypothetical protein
MESKPVLHGCSHIFKFTLIETEHRCMSGEDATSEFIFRKHDTFSATTIVIMGFKFAQARGGLLAAILT